MNGLEKLGYKAFVFFSRKRFWELVRSMDRDSADANSYQSLIGWLPDISLVLAYPHESILLGSLGSWAVPKRSWKGFICIN
jgi:hypothetical protein